MKRRPGFPRRGTADLRWSALSARGDVSGAHRCALEAKDVVPGQPEVDQDGAADDGRGVQ